MMNAIQILESALRLRASDVHLAAGVPPLARIDGEMAPLPGFGELSPEDCKTLIYGLLTDELRARFEQNWELDSSFAVSNLSRFRVNVLMQRGNVEAVVRMIPASIPTPEFLGLGPLIMGLADLPRGLVLIAGPTGSGKTSTLACLLEHINRKYAKHIITIEDPIEFVYPAGRSLIRQREVGADTRSFQSALREALREDPDVIMVGEMRDLETIALALTAAETGHLCFSTVHTLDAAQTVERIIDVFPPQQQAQIRIQLSGVLKAVVSQILLPRRNVKGRVAARGLMLCNPAISNLIREGKTHMIPNVIETSAEQGMFNLDRAMGELVRRGVINLPDALVRAQNSDSLTSKFTKAAVAV